ncbi:MAG: hypothetical protein JRH01_05965 [Deltaproteobacteria bacterium]|nr:hypothetical protein [Deltaproteobacteria bacterium]
MKESHTTFSGSVPAAYDARLGPLLFEFSAAELAERVAAEVNRGRILESACGTGVSPAFLRKGLAPEVEINERANATPQEIVRALADELERSFGPAPLHVALREMVFTGNARELISSRAVGAESPGAT